MLESLFKHISLNAFTFIADLHFYCKHHRYFLSLSFTFPSPFTFIAASLLSPLSPLRNRTQKRMNLFAFQIAICESFTQTSPRISA